MRLTMERKHGFAADSRSEPDMISITNKVIHSKKTENAGESELFVRQELPAAPVSTSMQTGRAFVKVFEVTIHNAASMAAEIDGNPAVQTAPGWALAPHGKYSG